MATFTANYTGPEGNLQPIRSPGGPSTIKIGPHAPAVANASDLNADDDRLYLAALPISARIDRIEWQNAGTSTSFAGNFVIEEDGVDTVLVTGADLSSTGGGVEILYHTIRAEGSGTVKPIGAGHLVFVRTAGTADVDVDLSMIVEISR